MPDIYFSMPDPLQIVSEHQSCPRSGVLCLDGIVGAPSNPTNQSSLMRMLNSIWHYISLLFSFNSVLNWQSKE